MQLRVLTNQLFCYQLHGHLSLQHSPHHQLLIIADATVDQHLLSQNWFWDFQRLIQASKCCPPGPPAGNIARHRFGGLSWHRSTLSRSCWVKFSGFLCFARLEVDVEDFKNPFGAVWSTQSLDIQLLHQPQSWTTKPFDQPETQRSHFVDLFFGHLALLLHPGLHTVGVLRQHHRISIEPGYSKLPFSSMVFIRSASLKGICSILQGFQKRRHGTQASRVKTKPLTQLRYQFENWMRPIQCALFNAVDLSHRIDGGSRFGKSSWHESHAQSIMKASWISQMHWIV